MAWEIESQEVDKAEGVHRFVLVERSVITRDGNPARHHVMIMLGTGADGQSCPTCNQAVQHGHTLQSDGKLIHHTGREVVPLDEAKKVLAQLNDFHARMDAHAQLHKAPIYTGPKK